MQCVGPLHTVVPPTFTELRRRGLAFTHELDHRHRPINRGNVIRESAADANSGCGVRGREAQQDGSSPSDASR